MAYFKIHRGANQIGGSCSEFCCGDERILIDFGANLPGSDEESPITDEMLKSIVFGNNSRYNAVLFTHYHGDHYGLYKDIPEGIPMYIGKTAKEILKIVTEYIDINAEIKGLPRVEAMNTYHPGRVLRIPNVSSIKVMPLVVDHSALDAYMFYIEMAGKKILYTGDFRDHGIDGEQDRLWHLLESDKYIPGDIDILITEGTMLSRQDEVKEDDFRTETELGIEAGKRFLEHKYNFVLVSSTNLDSIMEIYHNTPDDMAFVCDFYQARVISKAMQDYHDRSDFYKPKNKKDEKNKPLHLLLERGNKSIKDLRDENKSKGLYLPFRSAEMTKEYGAIKDGFVMLVRPNRYPEKGKNRFENALVHFSGLNEKEVSIMYSMWKGYLSGAKEDKSITRFIGDHYWHRLHVSGHAYPETILKLIEKTNPKVIIPMHTEMADEMSSMPLFEKYTNRIVTLNDNKDVFDIEKMAPMKNT